MQATGNLIGVIIKFSARVQNRHDNFRSRLAFLGMDIHRDAATIIGYGNRVIRMQDNINAITVPSQRFIDSVIHHFENHVMKAATVIRVSDVHAGALADRIQTT